jgi:hypothetical protein
MKTTVTIGLCVAGGLIAGYALTRRSQYAQDRAKAIDLFKWLGSKAVSAVEAVKAAVIKSAEPTPAA